MKIKTNRMNISSVGITALCLVLVACGTGTRQATTGMSDNQLEDLVRRSYQYIAIYIAAQKPEGVPEENWLPLNRGDYGIDVTMRLYVPDLEKFKTWTPPKAEVLK